MKKSIPMIIQRIGLAMLILSFALLGVNFALASATSQFSQTINAGTLATDIRDASRVTIANPSVGFSAKTFSFDCQSGGSASTATFGSSSVRLYVDNPGAANNGWTLAIAASSTTATWANASSTQRMDFNDPTSSGCTDSADAGDTVGGQMTIDANAGTVTADYTGGNTTGISKGASASFNEGSVDSITLLTGAAGSDDIGRWYLSGVNMSQTIPAQQVNDSYSINLTLTVTAS